nr:hypothetical protein [Tanacetum cinerariifolium]
MQNPKDSFDPITTMNTKLALLAKAFKANTIPTNNNQRSSLILRNSQIAKPGMNMSQDIKMQMVDDNVRKHVRSNAVQNDGNEYENGNVETAPTEGNSNGINGTQEDAYEETKRVKVNCTLEDTLQQASTSGTQSDKAPVYDSDGLTENDSNVISVVSSVEQDGGTVEQHSATVEETRAYHESVFHNLAAEVEKVNLVNRKIKETNAELTTEL